MAVALTWDRGNMACFKTLLYVGVLLKDGHIPKRAETVFLSACNDHLDSIVNAQSYLLPRQPSYRPSSLYQRWYCQSHLISQIWKDTIDFPGWKVMLMVTRTPRIVFNSHRCDTCAKWVSKYIPCCPAHSNILEQSGHERKICPFPIFFKTGLSLRISSIRP